MIRFHGGETLPGRCPGMLDGRCRRSPPNSTVGLQGMGCPGATRPPPAGCGRRHGSRCHGSASRSGRRQRAIPRSTGRRALAGCVPTRGRSEWTRASAWAPPCLRSSRPCASHSALPDARERRTSRCFSVHTRTRAKAGLGGWGHGNLPRRPPGGFMGRREDTRRSCWVHRAVGPREARTGHSRRAYARFRGAGDGLISGEPSCWMGP